MSANKLIDGEYRIGNLLGGAEKAVKNKTKGSRVLDVEAEKRIPRFKTAELSVGRVLGRGGFCVVTEVKKITLGKLEDTTNTEHLDDEHQIHNIVQDRAFMETHCIRGKARDCRYALKKLSDSSFDDAHTFSSGVIDLAVEARFLAVVRHPNIIKMRAMSMSSPYSADEPFFVVLDRLYDILGARLAKWKKKKPSGLGKMMDRKGTKETALWVERVTVAHDLSSALRYLHDMNIVYRDLKPENIGFDIRGDVKIFDFGLAREFGGLSADPAGMYKMTGDTGSPRYMAPEVSLGKRYNERVDVYSFSVLLWQILTLEGPYAGYTMSMFKKRIVLGGTRPSCDPKWPKALTEILRRGWGDARQRPSIGEVSNVLREEIGRATGCDYDSGHLLDASRKSDLSMREARKGTTPSRAVAPQQEEATYNSC